MLSVICSAFVLAGCQQEGNGGGDDSKSSEPATTAPEQSSSAMPTGTPEVMVAKFEGTSMELGCGRCIYKMEGVQGCPTAAVVNGKPMLIQGVGQSAHEHGLCSRSGMALVSGEIEGGSLVTTSVEMQ